ncbi:Beta sliding clamp [Candidatus Profftia lariciata]|uniref:DNA polymerase III subunit beta n=1 Tax=Candidatus Profftia lariciata TaxID=1987921 RepID=UPI001D01D877|nr:DNA polymerase III subunit beta [Candidatus Profftia lariciata]UDG81475.1 Beta sliding clamp [Candidatus Profftia lariciata]
MKCIVKREHLLKPLQQVISTRNNRPTLPILGNLLLQVKDGYILLTVTDLEVEVIVRIPILQDYIIGKITVSARKFFDICRGLPDHVEITVILKNDRILVHSGRSSFYLATMPAVDFPNLDDWRSELEFSMSQTMLKKMIDTTQFSMAHQDVRYYLNGMFFQTEGQELRTVATDGHRLAVCSMSIEYSLPSYSIIIPRKSVIELYRLLEGEEKLLCLQISRNNIRVNIGNFIFTSKLIDGRFPNYLNVLPANPNKILKVNCNALKQAFTRAAILSNEKFRGVRLYISKKQLKITANNSAQEEAEELLDVIYEGTDLEIGFNVNYVLDVLNVLKCEDIYILLTDELSSVQIKNAHAKSTTYVIMPIRL